MWEIHPVRKISADFNEWAARLRQRIERVLDDLLPSASLVPSRLHDAMRYAVLDGGKRVRPLLAFAAGEATGADPAQVARMAAVVELVHAYSLVHDDLPSMDDDALRRGKPTCHIAYDEATALLVGDSLHSLAFQVLAETAVASPEERLEMVGMLAKAVGSRGMAGGQAIDLESVGQSLNLPELELMHIHKTGALICAAVRLGAGCGRGLTEERRDRLDHYAKCVGLAFQVVDDVLDAEASTATLGKTAGKDAARHKPTYVSVLGVDSAQDMAGELYRDALGALAGFGGEAERLRDLAGFIVQRRF